MSRWYLLDDLVQDGYLCYLKCRNKYALSEPEPGQVALLAFLAGLPQRHGRALRQVGRDEVSRAAQTASTSYQKILTSDVLKNILMSGVVPDDFKPHVMTLLDEAPVQLVVSAIHETSIETNTPTKTIMKHVSAMAKALHTHRTVW